MVNPRFRALLILGGFSGWLAITFACRRGAQHLVSKPPFVSHSSVLLITLDTTRADHLSCYAADAGNTVHQFAETPHFDALARRGVRFVHATAQVPLTLPSHAGIFTGTYPEVNGMREMSGFKLSPYVQTMAELAHDLGIGTAGFVGSRAVARQFGLGRGFDVYDDQMPFAQVGIRPSSTIAERRASVTTDHALAWLRRHGQERFFLWIHYYDPHFPYDPPQPFYTRYKHDLYSGEIAYVDEQAGRILSFLDHTALSGRTLVIVTSDHGEGLFQHGEGEHGVFLYDDTLRVPLIISGPGVPTNKAIPRQVRLIDILPTVAKYLGVTPASKVQGVSLWPLMQNGWELPGKGSNYSYLESILPKIRMHWSELRGMRTDRWKFILAPHPELYDLENDPEEKRNVVTQNLIEADELQRKIWEVVGPPGRTETVTYNQSDHQSRQELASLGYVNAGAPHEIILDSSGPDPKEHVASLLAVSRYRRLMVVGEFHQAAGTIQRVIPSDSADPALRIYLLQAYQAQRDWLHLDQACRAAEKAGIVASPIWAFHGEALMQEGRLNEAIPAMRRASRLDPTDINNLYNLGTTYLHLFRPKEAEETFQAMLTQGSHPAAAYDGLGLAAVQRDDLPTAVQDFQRAIAANPDNPAPLLDLGVLCEKTGNRDLALRYLSLFVEKAPPGVYGAVLPQVQQDTA